MYLDDYIKAQVEEASTKFFRDDSYVSQKIAEVSLGEKQGELTEIEYDAEYSDVNAVFLGHVIAEYWELKRSLMSLVCALTHTQPTARDVGESATDFNVKAKLFTDVTGYITIIQDRLEKLSDNDRPERVLAIAERLGNKNQVEALYWYDTDLRYRLLDDCRAIKRFYAFTRDYIRRNEVALEGDLRKGALLTMMI